MSECLCVCVCGVFACFCATVPVPVSLCLCVSLCEFCVCIHVCACVYLLRAREGHRTRRVSRCIHVKSKREKIGLPLAFLPLCVSREAAGGRVRSCALSLLVELPQLSRRWSTIRKHVGAKICHQLTLFFRALNVKLSLDKFHLSESIRNRCCSLQFHDEIFV